eukprot:5530256-Pyramimonas_sp.AAC.1
MPRYTPSFRHGFESEDDEELVLTLPIVAGARAEIFTVIPAPYYGRCHCVDLSELPWGHAQQVPTRFKSTLASVWMQP